MKEYFTITDLAKAYNVSARTLRYYEEHGLLAPLRKGNQRLYRNIDRQKLQYILRAKFLGFSLKEIYLTLNISNFTVDNKESIDELLLLLKEKRDYFKKLIVTIKQIDNDLNLFEEFALEKLAEFNVNH